MLLWDIMTIVSTAPMDAPNPGVKPVLLAAIDLETVLYTVYVAHLFPPIVLAWLN
jgi:hypothetical protein